MPRHRIFKSELKKKATYKPSGTKNTKRTQDSEHKLGNIPFSEEMLTKEEVSNEYAKKTDVVDLVETTWAELKALRDAGNLVPGRQYRITDYVATVANDPNARSANHPFDLIVVADSENKLNEKARAIRHAGDTYFPDSVKFEAWQVWYCIENDTSRFGWADATNGRGVIYRFIDEWRNDCPYDFKGIQFARWELSNPVGYIFDSSTNEWVVDEDGILNLVLDVKSGLYGLSDSDGVLIFGYDDLTGIDRFKIEYTVSESPVYVFTFGSSDHSVSGTDVRENVIRPFFSDSKLTLNNISFLNTSGSTSCTSNVFGCGCSYNTFGSSCYLNTFGDSCQAITFGGGCYSNTIRDYCTSNVFGGGCYSNTLGDSCSHNTLGDSCYYNALGDYCTSNTFVDSCYANALGDYCTSNVFWGGCYANALGDYCTSNVFGGGCQSNTFGNYCQSNTFGGFWQYNVFGDGCKYNVFGDSCEYNVFGDGCEYNVFGDEPSRPQSNYRYITFEPGVIGVNLVCTHSSVSSSTFQNVTVAKGVSYVTISDPNIEQAYKTTYEATGSKTIDVSTL